MRQYFENEDDFPEEEIEDIGEMEEFFESMGIDPEAIGFTADSRYMKYNIFLSVITVLEKSFFWKFRSVEWKINAIKRAYLVFVNLLEIE